MMYKDFKSIVKESELLESSDLRNMLEKVEDLPKTGRNNLKNGNFPFKNTNGKLGRETICANSSSSLNCFGCKMGLCEHGEGESCYAMGLDWTFKGLFYQNSVMEVLWDELDPLEIFESLKDNKEIDKIKYCRFNDFGEFKDLQSFKKAEEVAKMLYNEFGIISFTYTHNKHLPISYLEQSIIVVNYSYNTSKPVKKAITAFKWDKKYLDNSKYIICTCDCANCPYCKDKDEKRTVVFMAHGKGYKGLKMLPKGLYNVLYKQMLLDNANFVAKNFYATDLTLEDFL